MADKKMPNFVMKETVCEICGVPLLSEEQFHTVWCWYMRPDDKKAIFFCGQPHLDQWKQENNVR